MVICMPGGKGTTCSGKRIFRDGSEKKTLKLVETKTFTSGVVVLSYEPVAKEDEK
jgi:hypothetical protein